MNGTLGDFGNKNATAALEDVLITEQLRKRPRRAPDYERESKALTAISEALAGSPDMIVQRLTEVVMEALGTGSAGISLLRRDENGESFHWPAIAGAWKPFAGGGMPYAASPCGVVIDRASVQLFALPERFNTYMNEIEHPIEEALLSPFFINGKPIGTVWAINHERGRAFDNEDVRLLAGLTRFAAAAFQVWQSAEGAAHDRSFLKDVVETSPALIVVTDERGRIVLFNSECERVTGYKREEVHGKMISELFLPEEWRPIVAHRFANMDSPEVREPHMNPWRTKSGEERLIEWRCIALPNADGRPRRVLGAGIDITQHRQAETALFESGERLRVATAVAKLGLHDFDVPGGTVQ